MTPDVNVLVAASRLDHPHHVVAYAWLKTALGIQRLAILPMVAWGFLRLVTHPKVFLEPTPLLRLKRFCAPFWMRRGFLCRLWVRSGPRLKDCAPNMV